MPIIILCFMLRMPGDTVFAEFTVLWKKDYISLKPQDMSLKCSLNIKNIFLSIEIYIKLQ
jgi:hypothetical protein